VQYDGKGEFVAAWAELRPGGHLALADPVGRVVAASPHAGCAK
jgi:hypothetical protein